MYNKEGIRRIVIPLAWRRKKDFRWTTKVSIRVKMLIMHKSGTWRTGKLKVQTLYQQFLVKLRREATKKVGHLRQAGVTKLQYFTKALTIIYKDAEHKRLWRSSERQYMSQRSYWGNSIVQENDNQSISFSLVKFHSNSRKEVGQEKRKEWWGYCAKELRCLATRSVSFLKFEVLTSLQGKVGEVDRCSWYRRLVKLKLTGVDWKEKIYAKLRK